MINRHMLAANPQMASLFGTARASTKKRKKSSSSSKKKAAAPRAKKRKVKVKAKVGGKVARLVKGSKAAIAWGKKMKALRKK